VTQGSLEISESKGPLTIEVDRDAALRQIEGPVRITAYGGVTRISGVKGTVDATGNGRRRSSSRRRGASRWEAPGCVGHQGRGRPVSVNAVGPTSRSRTPRGRDVTIDAEASVRRSRRSEMRSASGDVALEELNGPVDVEAKSGEVRVSWSSMTAQGQHDHERERRRLRYVSRGATAVSRPSPSAARRGDGLPRSSSTRGRAAEGSWAARPDRSSGSRRTAT